MTDQDAQELFKRYDRLADNLSALFFALYDYPEFGEIIEETAKCSRLLGDKICELTEETKRPVRGVLSRAK